MFTDENLMSELVIYYRAVALQKHMPNNRLRLSMMITGFFGGDDQPPAAANPQHLVSGFSLIELLVVIAIVAIIAVIGLPSFMTTVSGIRMSGEINGILGTMNFARSEAIKRGGTVSVCKAANCTDSTCCATTADCTTGAAQGWSNGWAVCVTDPILAWPTPITLSISPGVNTNEILTSNIGAVQFTKMGYPLCNGTTCDGTIVSLRDIDNTASLTRCLYFTAGLYATQQTTANCP